MTPEELQAITIEVQPQSTVKITGEIPFAYLAKHRNAAVKKLGENISADGFRKGHIPEKVIIERVGEMTVLTEMAERALSTTYPSIIKHHEIDAIGYPQISITKIAEGNPLGFSATVAVLPEITLPDYHAIAKGKNAVRESDEVTDEEVEEQINDILRQKVAYERLQEKAAEKAKTDAQNKDLGGATELPTPETVSQSGELAQEVASRSSGDNLNSSGTEETHTHADGTVHEGPAHEASDAPANEELPELTDELVKTLGQPGQFENVEDFKNKIREHLSVQKVQDNIAKHRASITDAIVEKSSMELPQVMVDAELGQMFAQMEDDLTRAGLSIDDYLGHIKKTREDLKLEWAPAAQKRAKLQLVLNDIAHKEDIKADPEKVEQEVAHLLEHHKDADKERVRIYVTSVLQNEAVMKMLESS